MEAEASGMASSPTLPARGSESEVTRGLGIARSEGGRGAKLSVLSCATAEPALRQLLWFIRQVKCKREVTVLATSLC